MRTAWLRDRVCIDHVTVTFGFLSLMFALTVNVDFEELYMSMFWSEFFILKKKKKPVSMRNVYAKAAAVHPDTVRLFAVMDDATFVGPADDVLDCVMELCKLLEEEHL